MKLSKNTEFGLLLTALILVCVFFGGVCGYLTRGSLDAKRPEHGIITQKMMRVYSSIPTYYIRIEDNIKIESVKKVSESTYFTLKEGDNY